jgi:3-hydroxyisobutyrate dehydrogenase
MKLAFIGLGVMGYPMAGHLQHSGHQVTVYNRTAARAEHWLETYGGRTAATPALAAAGADLVMVCVGNDDDVRAVCLASDGCLAAMQAGSILVDHTTVSAGLAEELAASANERGIGFVDAPVSGGQAGADNGALTVMCGGSEDSFARASDVMACYGKTIRRMGPVGFGQKAKMANQLCIAGLLQGLSEGMRFAQAAGLDVPQLVDVLKGGAAQSWQMENRAVTMAQGKFDFGFALDWMRKDLAICFTEAEMLGLDLPVAKLVDSYYEKLQQAGDGRLDTSSLVKLL